MWILFAMDMKKSKNFKTGIDFACGEMGNYKYFKTTNYLGVDIDFERLRMGAEKYPMAQYIQSSIEETSKDVSGDFVVCVQTIRINKYFNKNNTFHCIQKLISATQEGGG